MTSSDTAILRRRLESVRKDDLAEIVLSVTSRIGGHGALIAAINETANARAAQRARRRHSASAERGVRA